MKKQLLLLLSLIILPFAITACGNNGDVADITDPQPVYSRINTTGTIRCGYVIWPPIIFSIDPNTQQKSGIFYDVMEEVGKRLNLKIDWSAESSWGNVVSDIQSNRFDMVCSAFWVGSNRARQVDFATPVVYQTTSLWVSGQNNSTFESYDDFNTPDITFSFLDGSTETKIIASRFPKAKTVSLPDLTSGAEILLGLANQKYDATILDDGTVSEFLLHNPGKVKKVALPYPVSIYPTTMLLPAGETKLKAMIDNTINEMHYDGTIRRIIKQNNAENLVKLPALPYQD